MLPELPNVSQSVGGREVIASGALVLTSVDAAAVVAVDDLTFNFVFVPDEGDVAADAQLVGPKAIRVRFTGTLPFGPIAYELGNVGNWHNYQLTIAVMISGVTEPGRTIRQLIYTVSGTPLDLAPYLDFQGGQQ